MSSRYVELHAHSAFSFLDGASQPDELAMAAAEYGTTHLALTDHNNLCGALEFAHAAQAVGVVPITGAELTITDDLQRLAHVTVLARTAAGYANLSRLITMAYAPRGSAARVQQQALASARQVVQSWESNAPPGRVLHGAARVRGTVERPDPVLSLQQLCAHADGLTLLTGCATHGLLLADIRERRISRAAQLVQTLQDAAGREHVFVELQLPQQRGDTERNRGLRSVAEYARAPVVATGNVHAHTRMRARLHEVLVAIRGNTTLEGCEAQRSGNLALMYRSPDVMERRFADHPDAIANTVRIAESIEFSITNNLGYRYPSMSDGRDPDTVLAQVCAAEMERRYAGRSTYTRAQSRLESELQIVRRHGLSGFFLLHRDVLELAREVARDVRGDGSARHANPPGRGRGSSVESLICYLTGLSHIDPLEANLRMGRFLNEDMPSIPDIDLDFPRDIRHELLRRVVGRYGADRCAMVAAHGTFRVRSAIRDVGKALGLPQAELTRIAKRCDARDARWVSEALGKQHQGPRWDAFRVLTSEIADLPRQIGQHSGGVIVATEPLDAVVPIQPAAMPGRQICQWDKDSCSDAGFLKIDVLGLGMLSAVEECIDTIAQQGSVVDLSRIDYADASVYDDIASGDTVGTFQIESRAQIQSLKRTRPQNLHDLTIQVALIRPGPIIGKSVNPYVAIREAQRVDPSVQPHYDHPLLEPVLRDTYGAIIFQDQVIEVAMAIAGFSAGEADGLRRAMTRKRSAGSVEAHRDRFRDGAVRRGVDSATAQLIFDRLIGFCHYGFPRAHSVAFALLAYQSAWLRRYWPAHFFTSLLNAQPMGFYPSDSLLRDASRRGVASLPVDINQSAALCAVEGESIRIGFALIRGVSWSDAVHLEQARRDAGGFEGIDHLARSCALRTDQLEQLVMAGACDCFGVPRREQLWQLGLVARRVGGQESLEIAPPDAPAFSQLSLWDEMMLDFSTQGLSTRAHPVELLRPLLASSILCLEHANGMRHGAIVEVVGAVVARQKPGTAKGVVFMLLEDESGTCNVVIDPALYTAQRLVVRGEPIVRVRGRIERHGEVVNLIAREIHRLPNELRGRAPRALRAKNFC